MSSALAEKLWNAVHAASMNKDKDTQTDFFQVPHHKTNQKRNDLLTNNLFRFRFV
jgi:hypothetical protein